MLHRCNEQNYGHDKNNSKKQNATKVQKCTLQESFPFGECHFRSERSM